MHVDKPTRITEYSETMNDYVCSNIKPEQIQCTVVSAGISDYEAVLCRFSMGRLSEQKAHRRGRLFTRKNYCNFEACCSGTCWRGVLDSADPLNSFQKLLCGVFNHAFPLALIKSRSRKPWITNGLRVSARNMRCLHYIRNFYLTNIHFIPYLNSYRKIYIRAISAAKKIYYRIRRSEGAQREICRIIGQLQERSDCSHIQTNLTCGDYYCSISSLMSDLGMTDVQGLL